MVDEGSHTTGKRHSGAHSQAENPGHLAPDESATGARLKADAASIREVQPQVTPPPPFSPPRAPQLLLGEVRASPAPTSAITPVAPPRNVNDNSQTRGTAEATEVHVHIGRIDVTAVQEPAQAKKSRIAAPRNTLTLSDYLARRRRS